MSVDVVVPVYRDLALTRDCLRSVLDLSGPALARLIVVNDASPEPEMAALLERFRRDDARVRVLTQRENSGFVASANLGLAVGESEVVLLNSDARVTSGWLDELLGALAEQPRLAALSPLSNNATLCSVPDFGLAAPVQLLEGRALPLGGLPRVTPMPTVNGFCVLFRRAVLDEVGFFDRKYGRGYNEENDWCQRARAKKWIVGRANRALVFHHGEVSFTGARERLDVLNGRRLVARYPNYIEENRAFEAGPHARVAARAVRSMLGRLVVQSDDPAIRAHFGEPRGPADVTCLRGVGEAESRGIVITLLDRLVDDSRLEAQVMRSERIVTETPELKLVVERTFSLPPGRVQVKGDLLEVIEDAVLRPQLLAAAEGAKGSPS